MASSSKSVPSPVEILLVEDNPDDATFVSEAIVDIKYPIRLNIAEDGARALDYLFQKDSFSNSLRPDLILMDLRPPLKSGLEVLKEIREDSSLSEIPVIVLTGSSEDMDRLAAYEFQANFFMVKPKGMEHWGALAKYLEDFWIKSISHHKNSPHSRKGSKTAK
jgi:two-component system response regulator